MSGLIRGEEISPLPIEMEPLYTQATSGGISNKQWVYRFPNDYGASVVIGPYTYGGPEGLYELAVLRFTGPRKEDSGLCYSTPITSDVLGWLTIEDVAATLVKVAAL